MLKFSEPTCAIGRVIQLTPGFGGPDSLGAGSSMTHMDSGSFQFPSGAETGIKLDLRGFEPSEPVLITSSPSDAQGILEILMTVDALRHADAQDISLWLGYLPYARQDRVSVSGEAFALGVMADLLNPLGFSRVYLTDAHSETAGALIHRSAPVCLHDFYLRAFSSLEGPKGGRELITLCSPDAGAVKKVSKVAEQHKLPMTMAFKSRNPATGALSGVRIASPEEVEGRHIVIVDDICDGGGTFINLAKELRREGAAKVSLVVTHGLFTKGLSVFDGLIDTVVCSSTSAPWINKLASISDVNALLRLHILPLRLTV